MFINKSMTRRVITIEPEADVFEAQRKMSEHNIRHLPVVDESGKLVGIVTDRDLRSAMPLEFLKHQGDCQEVRDKIDDMHIRDIMTPDPATVTPHYTIQDALLLIQKLKVGALPVVDDQGRLTGIISVRDLLQAFINVLGIGEPGMLLCILAEDKLGEMKRIVDAITEENISVGSILVARYWDKNKRAVFPYLMTNNVRRIKKKLQALGFTLLDPMEWYLDQMPKNE